MENGRSWRRYLFIVGPAALVLSTADPLFADVTYESEVRVVDRLVRGTVEIEQKETVSIKGDMRKEEIIGRRTVTTRRGRRYTKPRHKVFIQRLDKGLTYEIDLAAETYTKESFVDERRRRRETLASTERALGGAPRGTPPRIVVRPTGETKRLNGYDCRRYLLTATVEGEPGAAEGRGVFTLTLELWMTGETDWSREILDFEQRLAEQRGIDEERQIRVYERRMDRFAKFNLADLLLKRERRGLKGFPMRWEEVFSGPARGGEIKVLFRLMGEITRLEVRPLKEGEFELPQGLTKVGM